AARQDKVRVSSPCAAWVSNDMIRVAMRENQVLDLVWRTAKPADRPEDDCLLTRVTGVDQRKPIVASDFDAIGSPTAGLWSDGKRLRLVPGRFGVSMRLWRSKCGPGSGAHRNAEAVSTPCRVGASWSGEKLIGIGDHDRSDLLPAF